MSRKCTQIALGGVFSAMCLMLMFMTGMIPFASYVMPAVAGVMLIAVMVENGRKAAVMVYVSVAALSVFIVPDREAVMMFIVFFGYYPLVKDLLDSLPPVARLPAKALVFNGTVVGGFLFCIYVLGMAEMMEGMGDFGKYTVLIFLLLGNLMFWVYDVAVGRYKIVYVRWFKPTFLRR